MQGYTELKVKRTCKKNKAQDTFRPDDPRQGNDDEDLNIKHRKVWYLDVFGLLVAGIWSSITMCLYRLYFGGDVPEWHHLNVMGDNWRGISITTLV